MYILAGLNRHRLKERAHKVGRENDRGTRGGDVIKTYIHVWNSETIKIIKIKFSIVLSTQQNKKSKFKFHLGATQTNQFWQSRIKVEATLQTISKISITKWDGWLHQN